MLSREETGNESIGSDAEKYVHNPHLEMKTKRMLYLAIPVNLLLWGSETWALEESDLKSLQVIHTKAIRKILGIGMTQE